MAKTKVSKKAPAKKVVAAKIPAAKAPVKATAAMTASAKKAAPVKTAVPAKKGLSNGGGAAASRLIDKRIKELNDWRGATLSKVRTLVKEAAPTIVESWKWRGVPVWEHGGIICTGETYKAVVKMTFAKGASLKDPAGLFNSSLEGGTRRAIDFKEGDKIDEQALTALVREAIELNTSRK